MSQQQPLAGNPSQQKENTSNLETAANSGKDWTTKKSFGSSPDNKSVSPNHHNSTACCENAKIKHKL
jgi:hypothetical protein